MENKHRWLPRFHRETNIKAVRCNSTHTQEWGRRVGRCGKIADAGEKEQGGLPFLAGYNSQQYPHFGKQDSFHFLQYQMVTLFNTGIIFLDLLPRVSLFLYRSPSLSPTSFSSCLDVHVCVGTCAHVCMCHVHAEAKRVLTLRYCPPCV